MSLYSLEPLINVSHDGRTLQMRPDQLTVNVLAKAFRLIPETVFLVSDRGTIAVAQDGAFQDVDDLYTWAVEGDKATTSTSRSTIGYHGDGSSSHSQGNRAALVGESSRWKPTSFQPRQASRSTVSEQA